MTRLGKIGTDYLVKEVILVLFLGILIVAGSTNYFILDQKLLFLWVGLITLAACIWLAVGSRTVIPFRLAVVACMGASILNTVFSIDPGRSAGQLILASVTVFLLALFNDLTQRGWPAELTIKVLIIVIAIPVLFGWIEAGEWYRDWLSATDGQWIPDVTFRLSGTNVVAMLVNLGMMMAVGRLLFAQRRVYPLLLAFLLVCLVPLYLTSSRGGWLGAATGFFAILVLEIRHRKVDIRSILTGARRRPAILALSLAGVGFLVGGGGWLLYEQTLHPTHGPLAYARVEFWVPAWETFLKYPLFGQGMFTFGSAYLVGNSVPPRELFNNAHSSLFGLLSEMGLVGTATVGWLIWMIGRGVWKRFNTAEGEERGVVLGVFAALVAFGVHSLVDSFHIKPGGLWILAAATGAVLGPVSPRVEPKARPYWTLLIIAGCWLGTWVLDPLYRGVELAGQERWEQAAAEFQIAVERETGSVVGHQQLGLSWSMLAVKKFPGALEQAVGEFEKVTRLETAWGADHANLGALYLTQGRLDLAQKEFDLAVQAAPSSALFHFNRAITAEAAGDLGSAKRFYRQALSSAADWEDASFWRSSAVRQDVFQTWRSEHKTNQDDPFWRLLIFAEEDLTAGRLDEGEKRLKLLALLPAPSAGTRMKAQWLQAELYAKRGDYREAARLGEGTLDGYRKQGIYGPGSFGIPAYAALMFRRPAMAWELVPQVSLIPLPDAWANRMARLAGWYERLGDAGMANQTWKEIAERFPDLKIDPNL